MVLPAPQLNPALHNGVHHGHSNSNNSNHAQRFDDFDQRIQRLQAQGADLLARTGQLRNNVADMADRAHAPLSIEGHNNSMTAPLLPPEENAELVAMIQQLTQQITDLRNNLSGLQAGIGGGSGSNIWWANNGLAYNDGIPAGVPQNVLDGLPRQQLTERSAVLKEAKLTWKNNNDDKNGTKNMDLQVVPAEFGALYADLQNVRLVATHQTATRWPEAEEKKKDDLTGSILVLRRGDITFAQKARAAQARGALGLVIVNDRATPWIYIMTDSTNDAADITIPVVMAPQGTRFPAVDNIKPVQVSLTIQENADLTCCVCTESFCNTTSIELPKCRHRFHEACVLTWLSRHNSCPYCRSPVYHHTTTTGASSRLGGVIATNGGGQDMAAAFYG
jgi:cell division protein FtsB